MEPYFATIFEDVRHERSLILLLSLTDSDILQESKFTDDELSIRKSCSGKITETANIKRISCCIIIRIKYIEILS